MRSKGIAYGLSFAAFIALSPVMISQAAAQDGDCVRTVRAISDFTIQGDAWRWWDRAAGQYDRDNHPALGSVLVFKRTGRLSRGHVSLVSNVIDRRTIEVDHTWLDGNGLRRNMRVVDVSPRNDWSAVRVWHEPSDQLGLRVYASYGFILPEGQPARGRVMEARDSGIDTGFSDNTYSVAPTGRGAAAKRDADKPRLLQASAKVPMVAVPGRKPQILNASYTPAPAKPEVSKAEATVVSVLPRRKPAAPGAAKGAAVKGEVASVEGLRTLMPGRKPGSSAVAELTED